jgi:hypothetical protein
MTADRVQQIIRRELGRHSERLDAALKQALAEPIPLEPGYRLQFEACPDFYRVVLCASEAELLPDGWLMDTFPEEDLQAIEDAGADPLEVISEAVMEWIAERWQAVGGPNSYSPAYAFFHGYLEQFDLEQRRWLSVTEAFGE